MAIEDDVKVAISSLFGGRVFYMAAPFRTPRPFCTYQFVGGRPTTTFCGETAKGNHRIQFNIWDEINGANGADSVTLMRQLQDIVTVAPLRGVSQGGLSSVYDDATKTFGARQDFSFWA
jgi:hypothetical protein